MRRFLASAAEPVGVALLGAALFAAWMHPAVLDPTNVGWLLDGNDRGQSAIGLAAYLRGGDAWPSLHQRLLNAPEGATLLFTDSIPLLGLLLKPWAGWLPPIQLIGLWYLACAVLQAGFAVLLVRPYAPEPLARWLGAALLVAMPVLFNRFGHASLCAQWLILWAIWVFLDARRAERPLWWAAVLGTAAAVHSYLLILCAAVWAGALLRRLAAGEGRLIAPALVVPLVPVAVLVWAHGVIGGGFLSSGSYGAYPAALDAWWNPANPSFSALLPSSPLDGAGGGGFEGFQYLGAGMLALVVLATGSVALGRVAGEHRRALRRLAWLVPGAAVLALVAVGPAPMWQGRTLWHASLPVVLVDALDPVRASGRLLWLATYLAAVAAVIAATARRRASLILATALALQLVDLAPMMAAIRQTSARADDRRVFARTLSADWQPLVARAAAIEFHPAEPYRDLSLMEEIEWRAVLACRPVRYAYTSRQRRVTRHRLAADARAFAAGRLDPTRLYVVLGTDVPPAVAARVVRIDGIAVIPSSRPAPAPSCSTP